MICQRASVGTICLAVLCKIWPSIIMRIAYIKIVLQRVLSKLTRDRSVLILHCSMSCKAAFKRFWNPLEKTGNIFVHSRWRSITSNYEKFTDLFTKLLLCPAPCFLVLNTNTGHGLGGGAIALPCVAVAILWMWSFCPWKSLSGYVYCPHDMRRKQPWWALIHWRERREAYLARYIPKKPLSVSDINVNRLCDRLEHTKVCVWLGSARLIIDCQ